MSPGRAVMAKRIRWQTGASLLGVIVACALLVYEGVVLSHMDQWVLGGAVLVLACVALLFGRDTPEDSGGP